jgi:hypothetical protein
MGERQTPYNHAGRWSKKFDSIFCPGDKITFPQYVTEMLVWCLSTWAEPYKSIKKGPGWSTAVSKQIRSISQQSYHICNHFPHPDDDKLVVLAFRNYFRKHKPNTIGRYRKTDKSATKAEKDTINAINFEYKTLKSQEEKITNSAPTQQEPIEQKAIEDIKFRSSTGKSKLKAFL